MNIIRNTSITILIILLASCKSESISIKQVKIDEEYVENENLCIIAKQKKDYLGKNLTISGTYKTDFLHYENIRAKCKDGEFRELAIGFTAETEKNNLIEKQWRDKYCGARLSCLQVSFPVTFRGVLNRHGDGVYFDVDEIIIDEKPEIRSE